MKVYYYHILILISLLLLQSCNEEDYSNAPMNNLANFENILFKDYNSLPAGSYPAVNNHFTPKNEAKGFLIPWLNNNYFSMDINSTASIIYNFVPADRADSLNQLSQTFKTISPMDYKATWGQTFVESFTPSKSAEQEIPKLLASDLTSQNPYRVVKYNYSQNEPIFEYNKEVVYLNQNFSFLTGATWAEESVPAGYFNKDMSGKGRKWVTYVINSNAQNRGLMAYCNYKQGGDVWFITEGIDLVAAVNPLFTFDLGTGYYKGIDCLKVLISDNFNGSDPNQNTWEDLSQQLGVKEIPTATGYPSLHHLKTIDLSKYAGKRVHIAIQYYLPIKASNYEDATLYVIDNLKVSETRDYASIEDVYEKYEAYKKNGDKWEKIKNLYVLQPEDYVMINREDIAVDESEQYISQILKSRLPVSTDKMVVIYKNSPTTSYAENYILKEGAWIKEPLPPAIQKRDKFIYQSNNDKWVYVSTEDVVK